ncbi:MAG: hypothetical protein IKS52_00785, partial [Clostridia bacterium]|nr:hypothetical protein [Clostridia bacterium]
RLAKRVVTVIHVRFPPDKWSEPFFSHNSSHPDAEVVEPHLGFFNFGFAQNTPIESGLLIKEYTEKEKQV